MINNSPIDDPNYDDDQENSNQWEERILEDAPPEAQWYHGRLDRFKAETRLGESNFANCYLIRESDRKPGAYVLSFKGKTGFNHFRITALCGDYYIGGRQFESLSHMIGYYRKFDLLKGEQLQNPVEPPEPVNDKKKVISILSHNAIPGRDELSFGQGEVFIITNDMGDDWMWATSQRDGRSGIVNRAFVQEWQSDESIEVYEWYHADISLEDTTRKLSEAGQGSWLVKPSENTKGHFTLYVYCEKQTINKFKIEYTSDHKYFIGGREFCSVEEIIQRYRKEDIAQGVKLTNPVIRMTVSNKIATDVPQRPSSGSDIYFKGGNDITFNGNLYKKCQKSKRWKNYFFVLNQTELLLYYFENPKRSKPKNLIDLNYCILYPAHQSLFSKSNVFQLILRGLNQTDTGYYYLSADTPQLTQEWISKLKPLCQNQNSIINRNSQRHQSFTQFRSLHLKIFNAKNLKQMSHPFCCIYLDKVKVAKTHINEDNDTCWDDDFPIEDFPVEVDSVIITIYSKDIMRKYTDACHVRINLNDLPLGKLDEKWYPLTTTQIYKSEKPPPSLRIKTKYINALIMPSDRYQALKELILAKDMEAVLFLASMCASGEDRTDLSTALLNIHLHEKQELRLIRFLLEQHIDNKECVETLFRDNTMFSSLMDAYMQAVGNAYLQEIIRPIIERVIENKDYAGSTRIETLIQDINFQNYLVGILNETFITIIGSAPKLPIQLKYIFTCLQQKVKEKWSNNENLRTTVVSCFVFLRFYCLAFTNPRKYNLIGDVSLSQTMLHILKNIGNFLNKLANLCEAKDGQMEFMNIFIVDNKRKIVQFIDSISNEAECPPSGSSEGIDLSRNLDTVHQICINHNEYLLEKKMNNAVVSRLYAVVCHINNLKLH